MSAHRTAPRKSDAERGPLGAWAYGARTLLQVSGADAAAAAGITEPTLRKIEGGSNRQPARRVVWDLWQYLAKRGVDQGVPVDPPPAPWRTSAPDTMKEPGGSPDLTGLVVALTRALQLQAEALTDIRTALAEAAGDAARERADSARLIGHLSDQLDELRDLVETQAGSAVPGSGRN